VGRKRIEPNNQPAEPEPFVSVEIPAPHDLRAKLAAAFREQDANPRGYCSTRHYGASWKAYDLDRGEPLHVRHADLTPHMDIPPGEYPQDVYGSAWCRVDPDGRVWTVQPEPFVRWERVRQTTPPPDAPVTREPRGGGIFPSGGLTRVPPATHRCASRAMVDKGGDCG